jgi:WS/DGAT/MGAT family acyltransferase
MAATAMSSADAAWLGMDRPDNPMVITGLLWLAAPVTPDRLRERLRERLLDRYPRFTQRPIGGRFGMGAQWEDLPEIDLQLHVRHVTLPAPCDEAMVRALADELASRPLDLTRPLWEVHLIEQPDGRCVLLARIHHCVVDGITLARVLLTLADGAVEAVPIGRPAGNPLAGALSFGARVASTAAPEAVDTLLLPMHLGSAAASVAHDADLMARLMVSPADRSGPLRAALRPGVRLGWSPALDLRSIRNTAHRHGATINDVLIAATTLTLGDRLRAEGARVDEVHAMVPFNLRPLDEPLPRDLGNRFGLVLLALPIATTDPPACLEEVCRRTRALKDSDEGAIVYGILSAMGALPAAARTRLVEFFSDKATMVLTNVPGPRERLALLGAAIERVLVWAPSSGTLGMSVSIFSYAGEVTIGFLANRGLSADPQALAAAMPGALHRLATSRRARAR